MAIHIRRRKFLATLGGAAAAWPLAARAQERLRRVGVLSNPGPDDAEMQSRTAAFEQGLQELGWMVGRNLQIDYRWSNGNAERLPAHAVELMALQPDVVLATSGVSISRCSRQAAAFPSYLRRRSIPSGSVSSDRQATAELLAALVEVPIAHEDAITAIAGGQNSEMLFAGVRGRLAVYR